MHELKTYVAAGCLVYCVQTQMQVTKKLRMFYQPVVTTFTLTYANCNLIAIMYE